MFRDADRELTREEYTRLLEAARAAGQERLAMLMETICAAGIRVSEVPFITVEAAAAGRAEIRLKGKIRPIIFPGKLCRKLLKYARAHKITSGEIFLTEGGKSLSRKQIWREMKALCAVAFYRVYKDIVKLADVLGHSSIETTRIYLMTSGVEHARCLERLNLIC